MDREAKKIDVCMYLKQRTSDNKLFVKLNIFLMAHATDYTRIRTHLLTGLYCFHLRKKR